MDKTSVTKQGITDPDKKLELRDVDLDHPAMQIALPLVVEHKGVLQGMGTAFSVAPGLAITAAHNVNPSRWEDRNVDGTALSITAYQLFQGGLYRWDVDAIFASVTDDIAFLRFYRPSWWGDEPDQIKPQYARLNFNPPKPGDEIRMFGFPESEIRNDVLLIRPSECSAQVEEVSHDHPNPDIPQWYAKLKGQILGGMSGGPCFDKNWNVVGVNNTGWSFLYQAHMALLWPAMSIEIDPFKTGSFPAVNLFNNGPAKALGYRRLQVTSKGQALLATVDPDDLVPLRLTRQAKQLEDALNFAAMNAQNALAEVRLLYDRVVSQGESLDSNAFHRIIRLYFWELDSTLRIALELAAQNLGITMSSLIDWDQLIAECRKRGTSAEVLDELAKLGFAWHGVDLFEVRTYADLCRVGAIYLISFVGEDRVKGVGMELCRSGGQQVFMPDGLDRFFEASRRFVQRLLRLSSLHKEP